MPKVSVVIPAHNAEKTIESTLRSFQEQTLEDFEVIVCNDRSTDQTVAIAVAFCTDSRFAVYNSPRKGAGATRNYGLSKAKGQYLICFDADDIADPDFLAVFIGSLEKYEADIVISTCREEDEEYNMLRESKSFGNGLVEKEAIVKAFILGRIALFPTAIALRRSILVKEEILFLENTSSYEDIPFWFASLVAADCICVVPTSHAAHVQHLGQSTKRPEVIEEEFRSEMTAIASMQKRLVASVQAENISESMADEIQAIFTNVCIPHAFVKRLEFLLRTSNEEAYYALLHSMEAEHIFTSAPSRLLFRHRKESWFKIFSLKYCRCIFESYNRRKQ